MTEGRGLFMVLEGLDGAGTTTQARLLARWLRGRGCPVHQTAEPSTGPVGALIRQALSHRLQDLAPETVALLFAGDRIDHLRNEIEPRLRAGVHVICDRYVHSSLAYQGALLDPRWVAEINRAAIAPDLTLLLKVDPAEAARRRGGRSGRPELYELDDFQRKVAAAYERAATGELRSDRLQVIDGDGPVRETQRACRAAIASLLR